MSISFSAKTEKFRQQMIKEIPKVPNNSDASLILSQSPTRAIISSYITWKMRLVPARKRAIRVFRPGINLHIFVRLYPDITKFLDKVMNGEDLNIHLSEKVRTHGLVLPESQKKHRGKDIDSLVLREGLHHFHFAPRNKTNTKGRSDFLIFAEVTSDTFTIVSIAPHRAFEHSSWEALEFQRVRKMYLEKDIPQGQAYMLNPVMCSGHTLEIQSYSLQCEEKIQALEFKIDQEDFINSLYEDARNQCPSIIQPKKPNLIWYFNDINLGLLERKSEHFFRLLFLRDR